MSEESASVVSAIARRLLVRSAVAGAVVGLIAGVAMSIVYVADITLRQEQFEGSNVGFGFVYIFVLVGVVVGPTLGLASGVGAVLLLRLRAAFRPLAAMHYLWTAGLGAGVVAIVGTVLLLNVLYVSPSISMMASVGLGFGLVSGVIAALQTQRLLTRA